MPVALRNDGVGGLHRLWVVMGVLFSLTALGQEKSVTIESLSQVVRQQPENVDLRFHLANLLWREQQLDRAYSEAERVVEQAPDYYDAHLMMARIDGVRGRYEAAFARVKQVLAKDPTLAAALRLWADLGLWSKRGDEALKAIDRLSSVEPGADVHYRRAQLAYDKLNSIAVFRHTKRALALEPDHPQARKLNEDTQLVMVDSASQFEIFPAAEADKTGSFGQTVVASILPRNFLSGALEYEYRYRFATHNHRAALRLNWRPTRNLTFSAYGRIGGVEVLPVLTAFAEVAYHFDNGHALAARYTYDRMIWPGQLHRWLLAGGIALPVHFRLEPAFELGLMHHCYEWTSPLLGPRLKVSYLPLPFRAGLQYGYGMELGRTEWYADDTCPQGEQIGDHLLPVAGDLLDETRYHEFAAYLQYDIFSRFSARGGYGIQLRANQTLVHMFHLVWRWWR